MSHIISFENISKNDVHLAGGKGASLGELTQAEIPVPPGFVIVADAFDRFVDEAGIQEEIDARLDEINHEDMNSIEKVSTILRDVIHDTDMPPELEADVISAFDKLDAPLVAVRSSATAEDSEIASWAGQLDTFLNTKKEHIILNVKRCWSSLFTPRALFYRHEKNIVDADARIAVAVQKMIQSEIAGVCFTVHPVTEDANKMVIEAALGLGEAIVSGKVTPDTYIVDKQGMQIDEMHIGTQKKAMQGVDNTWVDLGEVGSSQKLSGEQIVELAELCKKIEAHYGFPCDIEWAYAKNQFFITQSRPITTLTKG